LRFRRQSPPDTAEIRRSAGVSEQPIVKSKFVKTTFQGGVMVRAIAVFVLLFNVVSVRAETVLTPAAKGCTRASLQKAIDKYIEALKQGKPSLMPLAPQAKYIERRKTLRARFQGRHPMINMRQRSAAVPFLP
jgi:hypothetical protein